VAEHAPDSSVSVEGDLPKLTRIGRLAITIVATGAFVGYAPVLPGTAGSVLGLLIVRFALAAVWRSSPAMFLVLFGVTFIVACQVANGAERIFREPDCPAIVLDEILGMIATMFSNDTSWPWLAAGFTLFRVFDIIKPWPASWFDRMHGGTGIMLDDLSAACYANIALKFLRRVV
jgi:phosphatidylglycerophosphatase A